MDDEPDRTKSSLNVPRHVAMIMDGNRRWARRRSLQPWEGHAVGFDKVIEVASWVEHLGVEELTLWMLSTDNLKRSTEEIAALVPIICRAIDKLVDTNRFTIRHVGNRDVLPEPLHSAVLQLPHAGIGRTTVNLAIGYGGLDEIERGVRQYLREHGDTATALEHLNVAAIESQNARYRRAVNAKGHFPTEQAAMKTLYLVTRSLASVFHGAAVGSVR